MLSLKQEIKDLAYPTDKKRKYKSDEINSRIILDYFGLGDKKYCTGSTLEKQYEISRGWPRELFKSRILKNQSSKPFLPSLGIIEEIIETALSKNQYVLYSDVLLSLKQKGFIDSNLHPFGLFNIANYFQFTTNFVIAHIEHSDEINYEIHNEFILARKNVQGQIENELKELRKLPGRKGKFGIYNLNLLTTHEQEFTLKTNDMKKILIDSNDIWYYAPNNNDFWYLVEFGDKKGNPILTSLRKVKTISEGHPFEKKLLLEVVSNTLSRRDPEKESSNPPQAIIQRYMDESQFINSVDDKYILNENLDNDELEPIEKDLVGYAQQRSVFTLGEIRTYLLSLEKGYTEPNIYAQCNYSPLIKEIESIPRKIGKHREFILITKFNHQNLYLAELVEDAIQGGEGRQTLWEKKNSVSVEQFERAQKDFKETGELGEQIIFNYLTVENKFITDWIAKKNPFAPFDILLEGKTCIDVKSTKGKFNNIIHISYSELKQMKKGEYRIYRVYEISDTGAFLKVSKNLQSFGGEILSILNKLPD